MKKFAFSLVLFALVVQAAHSPNQEPIEHCFKEGEFLSYRVRYLIFNAGFATLSIGEKTINGREHFHVIGKGWNEGAGKLFFKVDDTYQTYIDKQTGLPTRFVRNVYEGGYTQNYFETYNHKNKTVQINNLKKKEVKTVNIIDGVQDMLSSFYYLRNQPTNHLKTGDFIKINIFMDEEIFPFKLKILGRETISSKFGDVKCIKIRPFVQKGRVFKEEESLTMWITDDKNHIPIRIKADLIVGSIKADLEKFSNVKYPIKFIND